MKKILVVTSHSFTSGIETHTIDLIKLLVEKGYRVEGLAPVYGPWVKKAEALGVPVHVYDFYKHYWLRIWRLIKIMRKGDYDIVHCHAFTRIILFCAFFAGIKKKIWSVHVGGMGKDILQGASRFYLTDKLMDSFVDLNIVNSEQTKRELLSRGIHPKKIELIYYWLDGKLLLKSRKKREAKKDMIFLGCIGRLVEQKGFSYMIKSLALLEDVPFYCLIAGAGPLEGDLKRLVEENDLESKVEFLGDYEKMDFYDKIDLLVVPSIYESLGLVVVEGAANGLPIIGSDLPVFTELQVFFKKFFLFKGKNEHAIAEMIKWCYRNRDNLENWGKQNRVGAKFFSKEKAFEKIKKVYGDKFV